MGKSEVDAMTVAVNGGDHVEVVVTTVVQTVHWIDTEKKTCAAWVELGFRYDLRHFLDVNGYFVQSSEGASEDLKKGSLRPEEVSFTHNIVNATKLELRSSAHFFRRAASDGSMVPLYGDNVNLVQRMDLSKCKRGDYVKCETYLYDCELVYNANEAYAPFDQLFLSLKLMTDASPGSELIKFTYDSENSSFKGMKHHVGSFYPVEDAIINKMEDIDVGTVSWDRFYATARYKRFRTQGVIQYYVLPTLIFIFVVVRPFDSTNDLLAIGSTLVIADVALLFVAKSNVLTLAEMAVLIQTVMLVVATLVLAFRDSIESVSEVSNLQLGLLVADLVVSATTLGYHYLLAERMNKLAAAAVRNGDFAAIDAS